MAQMYSVVLRNPLRYFDISCALIVLEEAGGPEPPRIGPVVTCRADVTRVTRQH